ncbi:MAG: hypothetical protein JWP11_2825 [Frankiales bacterium]|nr:hypothetical protein [Frankiales bacterium]
MSALDRLAAYLGNPDRPFDAIALDLVTQAIAERNGDLPARGHMGDDLDLPFAPAAAGSTVDLSDAVLAGGWVVAAAALPVPDVGRCPALVLTFSRYDGHLLRPVLLVLTPEQMGKVPALVEAAVHAAIRAAV